MLHCTDYATEIRQFPAAAVLVTVSASRSVGGLIACDYLAGIETWFHILLVAGLSLRLLDTWEPLEQAVQNLLFF